MNYDDSPRPLLERLKDAALGFGRRVLVHLGALALAGLAASSAPVTGVLAHGGVIIGAYIGLICLFPRGMGKTADWLLPVGAGLAQCLALIFLGVPWQFTLPWGGAQTWLQRLVWQRGEMGWEWSAAPWLVIVLFDNGSYVHAFPWHAAAGVAALGVVAQYLYARLRVDPIHRAMLRAASETLSGHAKARPCPLPEPLKIPMRHLAGLVAEFARRAPTMDKEAVRLALGLRSLAGGVSVLTRRAHPQDWDERAGKLLEGAQRLADSLQEKLALLPEEKKAAKSASTAPTDAAAPSSASRSSPQSAHDEALARRIGVFQESAKELVEKSLALPPELRGHIESLTRSAGNILECMRCDPADVGPGDKFLSRYLVSAHKVVDEYCRLSRLNGSVRRATEGDDASGGSGHDNVRRVLEQSAEILARLDAAFIDEHGRLLRNDTINFGADLNVLDKLLKMEGR